jgi:galactokinase
VALQQIFGFPLDPVETVKLCQSVEHVYAGVQCGIMDQFACRLGRRDHALLLDCRTLDYEHIPLAPDDIRVVIVNSGVKRALAGSKYNERRAECQQGVNHFHKYDPAITALRDVSRELLDQHAGELPDNVRKRCRHVVMENQRVLDAAELLRNGQLAAFGRLMNESHASLRDLYQVSCPELDALVEIGQKTDGVLGSRMTGGGFGGCTVHLTEKEAVLVLQERFQQLYPQRFNLEPAIFVLEQNVEAGPIMIHR